MLISALYHSVLRYVDNPRTVWEMTPCEMRELIDVRAAEERKRLEDSYRRNELLAFNIAALCRTAVNAPMQFPKTPNEAFLR